MDYEKKYREAIIELKNIFNNAEKNGDTLDLWFDDFANIFPELKEKESEDEQHRKWILEYLYDGLRKSDKRFEGQFKAAITWLKKQGDKDKFIKEELDCIKGYREKAIKRLEELKKQGKKSGVINIGKMVSEYASKPERGNETFGRPFNAMIRAYRQGLEDAVSNFVPKKPAEWNEADDKMLDHCCGAIWAADYYSYEDKEEMEKWVKSLKERLHSF